MNDKKVLCVGGRHDGKYVPSVMRDRWPYVLAHDKSGMLIGYYVREGDHFQWSGETEFILPDGTSKPV